MLKTKRLFLEPIELKYITELLDLFNLPESYYFTKKNLSKIDDIINYINCLKSDNYYVIKLNNGKFIGIIGFHNYTTTLTKIIPYVGYCLDSNYFRQGYISELLPLFLEYGFDLMKTNKIRASVDKNNIASIKLCEKFNFDMVFSESSQLIYEIKKDKL